MQDNPASIYQGDPGNYLKCEKPLYVSVYQGYVQYRTELSMPCKFQFISWIWIEMANRIQNFHLNLKCKDSYVSRKQLLLTQTLFESFRRE